MQWSRPTLRDQPTFRLDESVVKPSEEEEEEEEEEEQDIDFVPEDMSEVLAGDNDIPLHLPLRRRKPAVQKQREALASHLKEVLDYICVPANRHGFFGYRCAAGEMPCGGAEVERYPC